MTTPPTPSLARSMATAGARAGAGARCGDARAQETAAPAPAPAAPKRARPPPRTTPDPCRPAAQGLPPSPDRAADRPAPRQKRARVPKPSSALRSRWDVRGGPGTPPDAPWAWATVARRRPGPRRRSRLRRHVSRLSRCDAADRGGAAGADRPPLARKRRFLRPSPSLYVTTGRDSRNCRAANPARERCARLALEPTSASVARRSPISARSVPRRHTRRFQPTPSSDGITPVSMPPPSPRRASTAPARSAGPASISLSFRLGDGLVVQERPAPRRRPPAVEILSASRTANKGWCVVLAFYYHLSATVPIVNDPWRISVGGAPVSTTLSADRRVARVFGSCRPRTTTVRPLKTFRA